MTTQSKSSFIHVLTNLRKKSQDSDNGRERYHNGEYKQMCPVERSR